MRAPHPGLPAYPHPAPATPGSAQPVNRRLLTSAFPTNKPTSHLFTASFYATELERIALPDASPPMSNPSYSDGLRSVRGRMLLWPVAT